MIFELIGISFEVPYLNVASVCGVTAMNGIIFSNVHTHLHTHTDNVALIFMQLQSDFLILRGLEQGLLSQREYANMFIITVYKYCD